MALVSRSDTRHETYVASLAASGVASKGYVADVTDEREMRQVLDRITADFGEIDTIYFGPGSPDAAPRLVPITEVDADAVRGPIESALVPPINLVSAALPAMLERGTGAMFFSGGLSGKYPIPMLGNLAPASAALRMYVMTLSAALQERGIYVATLTIGGLIERGDIHRSYQQHVTETGGDLLGTLDPDDIADTAWTLYVDRKLAEAEFNALT